MRGDFADYVNVSSVIGVIVSRQLASLKELETYYSYEDALDMVEIITVGNYNEWAAAEGAKQNGHVT